MKTKLPCVDCDKVIESSPQLIAENRIEATPPKFPADRIDNPWKATNSRVIVSAVLITVFIIFAIAFVLK